MRRVKPDERGAMYAALVDSYRSGWTPFEAGCYFCGLWPDSYQEGEKIERDLVAFCNGDVGDDVHTAEDWFIQTFDSLEAYFNQRNSPIFELFEGLKKNDEIFLLEGLSKSEWSGYEANFYLSRCSEALYEASFDNFVSRSFSAKEREKVADYGSVSDCLISVMRAGVGTNFVAEFYGHMTTNKFNRSQSGMELFHPVACFRKFAEDYLSPQGLSPFIFQIADEIAESKLAADEGWAPVPLSELDKYWAEIPMLTDADIVACSLTEDEVPDYHLKGAASPKSAGASQASLCDLEVIPGLTVKDVIRFTEQSEMFKKYAPLVAAWMRRTDKDKPNRRAFLRDELHLTDKSNDYIAVTKMLLAPDKGGRPSASTAKRKGLRGSKKPTG